MIGKQSLGENEHLQDLFTMNVCISDCDVASKWVPLISMVLFTLSDVKHEKKICDHKYNRLMWKGPKGPVHMQWVIVSAFAIFSLMFGIV